MPDDINNGHEEEMVFISFIYLICFLSDISIAQSFDKLTLPPAFEHGFRVLTVQSVRVLPVHFLAFRGTVSCDLTSVAFLEVSKSIRRFAAHLGSTSVKRKFGYGVWSTHIMTESIKELIIRIHIAYLLRRVSFKECTLEA